MVCVIKHLAILIACFPVFSAAGAGSRCQKRLVHSPKLKALDSIWSEAEAREITTVYEKRKAILASGEDLRSVYLQAVGVAEANTKLRAEAIADEIAKGGIASFGGVDALVVGAGSQALNFVGGAVDALRAVRKHVPGTTGGPYSIHIKPEFPKVLVASPDGVAPALRLSPSASQTPVIWRRSSLGKIEIGNDPFPFPGSSFRTADLLGLSEKAARSDVLPRSGFRSSGVYESRGPKLPELKPWHEVFRSDYHSDNGKLSGSDGGLLFFDNQRQYEQSLLTLAESGVPLLDHTTVTSISWDFNSQTAQVVTGQGLTIQARSIVLETGLRVSIIPIQDVKSLRLFDRQSTDFRTGQIPLSFGTDSDVYLAAQQEGRSFLDRIRRERTLIIGHGNESRDLIEYILGLDPRKPESAGLANLTQYKGSIVWAGQVFENEGEFLDELRCSPGFLMVRGEHIIYSRYSRLAGAIEIDKLQPIYPNVERVSQQLIGGYSVKFSDGSTGDFDNVFVSAGSQDRTPDVLRTISHGARLVPVMGWISSESESENHGEAIPVAAQVEVPVNGGDQFQSLPIYLVGEAMVPHILPKLIGKKEIVGPYPDSFVDPNSYSLANLAFRSWQFGSRWSLQLNQPSSP
ncbi:MAG: hypothetical protein IPJ71_18880 [Bdellovibrionales bacterium]|nr:hypothetical protein [Bdellovibrionales bacterium]